MILSFISKAITSAPLPTALALVTGLQAAATILSRLTRPKIPTEAADIFSPAIAAALTAVYYQHSARTFRDRTFLLLISTWAARLAALTYSRIRTGVRDTRIDDFRTPAGARFWFVMHSLWMFLSPLSVWVSMVPSHPRAVTALDGVLAAVAALALVTETVADLQKGAFRARNASVAATEREPFCEEGLYRFSRFPNYFGEWMFWTALSGLGFRATASWTRFLLPASPLFVGFLLNISMRIATSAIRKRCSEEQFRRWCSISPFVPLPRGRLFGSV